LKSRTGILREARIRLEKSDLPADERNKLLDLLHLLTVSLDDEAFVDDNFAHSLLDAIQENGRILLVVEQQAAELDALKRITRNLTSSLELQEVLDTVVKEALALVKDALDAHIFLFQDEKLVFGASIKSNGEKNIVYSIPRQNGLTFSVARQKKVIIVEDMRNDPIYADLPAPEAGSIIGIPLMMGTRVIGVMNLARNRVGAFSQSELRLLTLLADQAAIAIINARLHAAVSQQARSDVLTNLPNRRALDQRLEEEIAHASHSGRPFSVVMMDLDGFKVVNDTYGHDVGDDVLRAVASTMAQSLRSTDFLARYGGDEMTLILPETDLPQASFVTRKLQTQLHNLAHPLPDGKTVCMGVTGGIALFPKHADSAPGLLRAADEALYRAKRYSRGNFLPAIEPTGELHPVETDDTP
jgi:diguanylate cyclase (GGDEF)-like protein